MQTIVKFYLKNSKFLYQLSHVPGNPGGGGGPPGGMGGPPGGGGGGGTPPGGGGGGGMPPGGGGGGGTPPGGGGGGGTPPGGTAVFNSSSPPVSSSDVKSVKSRSRTMRSLSLMSLGAYAHSSSGRYSSLSSSFLARGAMGSSSNTGVG